MTAQVQLQSRLLLNVVTGQSVTIHQLAAYRDQPLSRQQRQQRRLHDESAGGVRRRRRERRNDFDHCAAAAAAADLLRRRNSFLVPNLQLTIHNLSIESISQIIVIKL
jgi:hypothetical protein